MSLKRTIAISGGVILLLGVLLFCLVTVAYFYLPSFLESRFIPRLASDAGISEFVIKVRSIGFQGADLSDLRLGPRQNPALVVRSVQVDYTPEIFTAKLLTKLR